MNADNLHYIDLAGLCVENAIKKTLARVEVAAFSIHNEKYASERTLHLEQEWRVRLQHHINTEHNLMDMVKQFVRKNPGAFNVTGDEDE